MQDLATCSIPESPAIDPEHLARVTFGDTCFRGEILNLFLRESKALLDRLAAAKDDQEWRVAAHSLKGMARGIGAFPLAEAANEIELLTEGLRLERRGEVLVKLGTLSAEASAAARVLIG